MTKFAKIVIADIANGTGWRTSIFFTGCSIHCPGCFNKAIWDPKIGRDFTDKTIKDIIEYSKDEWNDRFVDFGWRADRILQHRGRNQIGKKI